MDYVLEFAPPMLNIRGRFNTFRLGIKWGTRLKAGDAVYLLDKPHSILICKAEVERVISGKLGDMAKEHAFRNHNQLGLDNDSAPERLIEGMKKRYGPQCVSENKRCVVIYLREIK